MADAAGRLKNLAALKSEPLRRLIHGADDNRRGIMRVKRGGAGGAMLLVGQNFGKLDLFLAPVGAVHVEHLGHRAPPNGYDERRLFIGRRGAFLGVKQPQDFNRLDVLLELLF